jgi:hypothetical protein
MTTRTLQPEILDSLPPTAPDAQHSRRDLERINRVMRNSVWLRRTAPRVILPDDRALEIGAGTGQLCRSFQQLGIRCDGLDLWPTPVDWPAVQSWHQGNVFNFTDWARYSAVVGNLIFHQFSNDQLALLGESIRQHARVIVACEPARYRMFQVLFRALCPLIGANHVTLHDGHVSIGAGFRGDELPTLLGLSSTKWDWQIETTVLGAYRMVAKRKS